MNIRRIQEIIELPVTSNSVIRGEISLPEASDSVPWVIFAHGLGSTRGGEKATVLKDECKRRGFAFGAFDFRGHGESDGRMVDLRGSLLLEDLDVIMSFAADRAAGPLFIFGSSMGGWATVWFSAIHGERVAACAVVAPAFDFLKRPDLSPAEKEQWRRTGFLRVQSDSYDYELGYGLTEEAADFDFEFLAARCQTPLIIFHGMKDDLVPYAGSIEFANRCASERVEVRLFKSGDHRLNTEKESIARAACDFFSTYIL